MPEFGTHDLIKLMEVRDATANLETLSGMPKEQEPDNWHTKTWYRILRWKIQHAIDYPIQIREVKELVDYSEGLGLEKGNLEIRQPQPQVINQEEIKPRNVIDIAIIAVLCRWDGQRDYDYFKQKYEIGSLEDGIVAIHKLWAEINEKHKGEFYHPIEPIVEAYLKDVAAIPITKQWDSKHPMGILKSPMGSVREIQFIEADIANLKEFETPTQEELQGVLFIAESSIIPNLLPLNVNTPDRLKTTTKAGAVSHEIRIFFEALMALEPHQNKADIMFRLGDLIDYLYPNGKFNWTNQLPYIQRALNILHFYATVPWVDDTGAKRRWRPVIVKSPVEEGSTRDTPIFLSVDMPPGVKQGMAVEKPLMRQLGKASAPKFNAYLTACYLWDKYGTQKGKIADPTAPIVTRDTDGYLTMPDGTPIYSDQGKRLTYSAE